MNVEDIYQELKAIGCCNRCCLRFLGEKYSNFEDPEKSLEDLLPVTIEKDIRAKKSRPNPCSACLGLLEDNFLDALLIHSCWENFKNYEHDTYRINLNSPPNILLRNKAVFLHIKSKFPDFYTLNKLDENLPMIPFVFKQSFKSKLDRHCGKKFDVSSGLHLTFTSTHEDNEKEILVMMKLDRFTYQQRGYLGNKKFGKKAVLNTLSTIDEKTFCRHVQVPPAIPASPLHIDSAQVEALPLFIGGRYCKYSRQVSQTPWFSDADGISTTSVSSIIFDGLHDVFGFDKDKMTFTASGREDIDVRCLGNGRPFFVKVESCKEKFPNKLFRKLEEMINNGTPDIAVFDMQQTDSASAAVVKRGEEMKKKTYIALCLIRDRKVHTEEILNKINKLGCEPLVIKQKTPVRVSHRRSLIVRSKHIHYMKATEVSGHDDLFQLMVQTQAGTYVKEFVHGDFGRTTPSLSYLVQADIDIFRLDVIAVDLDWPLHINSVPYPALNSYCTDYKKQMKENIKVEPSFHLFDEEENSELV